MIEDLQASLKKRGIGLQLSDGVILLDIPRRMLRDAAQKDGEYIAPPIQIKIDFSAGDVYCKGYSPH